MIRPLLRLVTLFLAAGAWANPALAQDAQGNDRPSNWRVTHQHAHGIWETICDERHSADYLEKRCYIRHVEVFSPRPTFAAQFLFVTATDGGEVQFGIEPGTLFRPGNFRLERDGETAWSTARLGCLTGLSCTFSREDALALLAEMRTGGGFVFAFRDRHGESRRLDWPLDGFDAALADFNGQSRARGLPTITLGP
ncbi:hypothetical protein [Aliiroseovarius sp.]|uniref:hypothetical protein n=1 Tax=Aliiroseovarius sp. TaxID=1872442 RepID=UPI003BAC2C76